MATIDRVHQALSRTDLVEMDLVQKMALLDAVIQEMLDVQVEWTEVSGRYMELKSTINLLTSVKSALQSAIRAEQRM